jgi:hypothetical protein
MVLTFAAKRGMGVAPLGWSGRECATAWQVCDPPATESEQSPLPDVNRFDLPSFARSRARGATWRYSMTLVAILASVALALGASPAFAYVGPGAGLSLLGAFWAC